MKYKGAIRSILSLVLLLSFILTGFSSSVVKKRKHLQYQEQPMLRNGQRFQKTLI